MRCLVVVVVVLLCVWHAKVWAQMGYSFDSSAVMKGFDEAYNHGVPLAPPRVPAMRPSFGYRPPPPPVRRAAASEGKCTFDASLWQMEPQSALANAIMFYRSTGISCEQCLHKCMEAQAATTQWTCRTLTYDHRWNICDLFAVNGTKYPHFLADYAGRDYFVYLQARAATEAEKMGNTEENERGNAEPQEASSSVFGAPSGANTELVTNVEFQVTGEKTSQDSNGQVVGSASTNCEGSTAKVTTSIDESSDSNAAEYDSSQGNLAQSLEESSDWNAAEYDTSQGDLGYSTAESSDSKAAEYAASIGNIAESLEENNVSHTKAIKSTLKTAKTKKSLARASKILVNASTILKESQLGIFRTNAKHSGSSVESKEHKGWKVHKSLCGADETERYAAMSGKHRTRQDREKHFVSASTSELCAAACDRDQPFTCASAVLSALGCELSSTRVNHAHSSELTSSDSDTIYLEKVCIPLTSAENTEKMWPTVENHILVGHVMEVADAQLLGDCLAACIGAEDEFGFVCKSAMWYPVDDDQNCLLNTESRYTQPAAFVAEDEGVQMLYFDVPRLEVSNQLIPLRQRDDPMLEENEAAFTMWSLCKQNATGIRHRYAKCKDKKDIRKCPKESIMCRHLAVKSLKEQCVAVRDSNGRKRCPHGVRSLSDGRREYCTHPIDCN